MPIYISLSHILDRASGSSLAPGSKRGIHGRPRALNESESESENVKPTSKGAISTLGLPASSTSSVCRAASRYQLVAAGPWSFHPSAITSPSARLTVMSGSQPAGGHRAMTSFVSFKPESGAPERKGVPRLSHKKSRTGCQRCRARRVKVRLHIPFRATPQYVVIGVLVFSNPVTDICAVQ